MLDFVVFREGRIPVLCLALSPQPALEVLRHWSLTGGWHDEETAALKEVIDTCLLATLTTSQYGKR